MHLEECHGILVIHFGTAKHGYIEKGKQTER